MTTLTVGLLVKTIIKLTIHPIRTELAPRRSQDLTSGQLIQNYPKYSIQT